MASQTSPAKASLDSLPAEVRSLISRKVLRVKSSVCKIEQPYQKKRIGPSTHPSTSTRKFVPTAGALDTALYAVSRKTAEEAHEAFGYVNTVLLKSKTEVRACRDYPLRHVELTDALALNLCTCSGPLRLSARLEILAEEFPRLRTVTIDTGNLWYAGSHREAFERTRSFVDAKKYLSVRSFIDSEDSSIRVACIALGVYELTLPFSTGMKVYLKNSELVASLPMAAQHARNKSIIKLASELDEVGEDEWEVLTLGWWLARHQAWRVYHRDGAGTLLGQGELDVVLDHQDFLHEEAAHVPPEHSRLAGGVRLEDLTFRAHGAEVLEWASELLALHCVQTIDYAAIASADDSWGRGLW